MQVRPIEFQESFARVPVEQARQQHLFQREPDLGRDQVARAAADERLLDLSRPVQTTETDAERAIVDPERRQMPNGRSRNSRDNSGSRNNTGSRNAARPDRRGGQIDFFV